MIIAQISDTHLLNPSPEQPETARRLDDLSRTVEHINRLDPAPDVVVHTGDVSHNASPAEYGHARDAFARLRMPVYPIVGNRDRRGAFLEALSAFTGLPGTAAFVQYAVDLGPLRIVAADTLSLAGPVGDVCEERIGALKALLGAACDTPTLLLMHHPPVEIEALRNPFQFASKEAARGLHDLVARHRQVRHILAGHTHRADRADIEGVPLSTAPSIATDLRRDRYPSGLADMPVYQVHHFDDAGHLVSRSEIVR